MLDAGSVAVAACSGGRQLQQQHKATRQKWERTHPREEAATAGGAIAQIPHHRRRRGVYRGDAVHRNAILLWVGHRDRHLLPTRPLCHHRALVKVLDGAWVADPYGLPVLYEECIAFSTLYCALRQ